MTLTEKIHEQIVALNQANSAKHTKGKIYPSSIGRCSRSIVYGILGYPSKPFEPKTLLIFENGTYFHDRIENICGNLKDIMITPEFSFSDKELNVSGRSDMIIRNIYPHKPSNKIITLYDKEKLLYEGPDNSAMIVELKSIKEKGFLWIVKTNKPDEKHVKQLHLYMYLTGIRAGLLLYENKNTQDIKEFLIKYDEKITKKVLDQIHLINECIASKQLPPHEYDALSMECQWCDFFDTCRAPYITYDLASLL